MTTPERITTAEAAHRLGVNVATVRRKVSAGELPGEREARPGGARWWVLWTDDLGATTRAHEPSHERAHARGDERDALAIALRTIGRLERELEIAHIEKAQLLGALNARSLPAPSAREPVHEPAHARAHEPAEDDRLGLHRMAHGLEKRRPWWWLRDWRKRGRSGR